MKLNQFVLAGMAAMSMSVATAGEVEVLHYWTSGGEAKSAAELKKIEAEKNLFIRAVGQVAILPSSNTAHIPKVPRPPVATQLQIDEAKVVQDSLSDEFDVSTLLDTDDALSFRRPGVGPEVTRKLRKGDWAIQREIDS